MLISFSVCNFRSFREKQTLSMVASARHPDHPEHLAVIPNDDHQALPVAVIYGANGSGKSNLVKALAYMKRLVLFGTEPKAPTGRDPFLLDQTSRLEPTEMEVQFAESGHFYLFGFRVDNNLVLAEWLSVIRDGKEILVYERLTTATGEVKIEPGPVLADRAWGNYAKARALAQVGALPNQLFLHATGKTLRDEDQGPVLSGAWHWFAEHLTIIPADASFATLVNLIADDKAFGDFAGDFLRRVATGVDRLRVDTLQVQEGVLTSMGGQARQIVEGLRVGETPPLAALGTDFSMEGGIGAKVRIRMIKSEHVTADGSRVDLPLAEESDGTRRLTHLLPALRSLCRGPGLFVIDEIDRSLHPLLSKGFVRTFLDACTGRGSQLIFTSHETAFLDLELLRRDEIWFADKKQPEGSTELYSLADFKVRTDLKIDKAYLQGRFEAVPPIETELPDWVRQIMDELKPKGAPESPLN